MSADNLNKADNRGVTPAFIAAQNGHVDVLAKLCELGVSAENLNQADNKGVTPAFIAAHEGHLEVIKFLLKSQAAYSQPYMTTQKSLMEFISTHSDDCKHRLNEIIQERLRKGDKTSSIALFPWDIAYIMGHSLIVDLLGEAKKTYFASPSGLLHHSLFQNHKSQDDAGPPAAKRWCPSK